MNGLGILSGILLFGGYPASSAPARTISEWGVEALAPIHDDRQIHTVNLQWRGREKDLWDGRVQLRLGATVSRASGSIRQLTGSFEDGSLREVELDSPGWGLGPAAEGRWRMAAQGPWALNLDLSTAVMGYDRRFPAGGDRYNGMLQVGPTLVWSARDGVRWQLGVRWMHVSNGQGMVAHNPSYEARGLTLRVQRPL